MKIKKILKSILFLLLISILPTSYRLGASPTQNSTNGVKSLVPINKLDGIKSLKFINKSGYVLSISIQNMTVSG